MNLQEWNAHSTGEIVEPEPEHGDDGTRYVEASNYMGYVHKCLCGDKFVDRSELDAHIEENEPMQKALATAFALVGEGDSNGGGGRVTECPPSPDSSTTAEAFGEE